MIVHSEVRSFEYGESKDAPPMQLTRLIPTEIKPLKVALRVAARKLAVITRARAPMLFPTYSREVARRIEQYHDEVRYSSLALAIQRIDLDQIEGSFAEVGVYHGVTSSFIHHQSPQRRFYLFDTFAGFPTQDLDVARDERFKDTSVEAVADFIRGNSNIQFRKGYFPETAVGLEGEKFALVMLDVDLFRPALEVLRFFYPRMARGGYFFMHDFNSSESGRAISRAVNEFMADKPELLLELPDYFGTAVFRKF
jgi:O-methyltransferase